MDTERPSFAVKPWQVIEPVAPPGGPIPSMICADEPQYLQWLSQERYTGAGVIVDCGPLLGGSTAALAEGLRRNARVADTLKAGRIRSYDLFEYATYMKVLFAGEPEPAEGENLLPRFLANTEPWRPLIRVHQGDVQRFTWTGEPIEVLFIDLAKNWTVQAHLLREFFPALIPGVSVIVQQDYFFGGCPWIHIVMECLADYVTPAHATGGTTLGFALDRAIPDALLRIDYERDLSAADKIRLIERAAGRFTGANRLEVMLAQATLLVRLNDVEGAIEILHTVHQSAAYDATVARFLFEVARLATTRLPHEPAARRFLETLPVEDSLVNGILTPGVFQILPSLRRVTSAGRPLYLWGAGAGGQQTLRMLQTQDVPVAAFVDRDPRKHGTTVSGVAVHAPSCLDRAAAPRPFVVASGPFASEIAGALHEDGWQRDVDYAVC